MNKLFNRALTISLSGLLAISSVFTSFADNSGSVNGGGAGSNQTGSTIEYIATHHAYQCNNGIQASIVRKDTGELVSNVVTLNNYFPTDVKNGVNADMAKYWDRYSNRTGAFNTAKTQMWFLNGAKTDDWFAIHKTNLANPKGGGVHYINHETGGIEEGKMYTYGDIEKVLKGTMDNYYNVQHPEYAEAYNAAGGSPIDPNGGVYAATGATKNFIGPVELINGRNTATGDNFKAQMNTKLPDGSIVLQFFLSMELTKRNGIGEAEQGVIEPLFHFTNSEMQARYDELKAQGDGFAIINVMKEYNLYAEFEDIAWMVNEVSCPTAPAGYNKTGLTNEAFWNTPFIYYGTPKNITYMTAKHFVEYIQEPETYARTLTPEMKQFLAQAKAEIGTYTQSQIDNNVWFDRAIAWFQKNNVGQTWDWSLAYQAFAIERSEPQMGLKTFADVGLDKNNVMNNPSGALWYWFTHLRDLGYGVMLFNPTPADETSTFDEQTYGTDYSEGPSEDKSKEGGNEAQNNIVKFYAKKTGNDYTYKSNYTREKTVGTIVIEDELIGGYTVDNWFTSPTYKKPVAQTDSYDDTKKSIENKQSGTDTGTVTLNKGETLYVRLIESPKVIKIYTTGGNTDKVETDPNPEFSDGKLIIKTPDDGYDYEENTQSPEDKDVTSWEEVPDGKTTTDTTVPIEDDTTVIYIHYNKDPEDTGSKLLLHENEISHQFNLSDANGGSLVDGIRKYSSVSSSDTCTVDTDPDPDDYDSCDTDYTYDYSDDWSFTITNDADYASNKTFTWAWVQTDQKDYSGNGLSESGGTGTSTPNGEIILQRTINDTVTLYPGKNGGNESKLQEMGLRAPSYTPAKARKDGATDQPTRKTWYETFTTNWQFHNANTPTAYFSPSCGHGGTDTDSHTNTGNEATLNETYSKANNTEVYGLWGRANAGLSEPNETSNLSSAKWVFNNLNFIPRKEHLKTSEIQFYPYYKMKFVSEINGAEQDAYLTSENLSKLLNVQRVDTSISANGNTSTGNSLYLDSTQWSIHTKAQTLLANNDVQDSRSLLPSGAIYTLSDGELSGNKAPNKYIGVHLYSTYVADKSKLANTGDILNESEANAQIEAFKEEVKRVLEGYEIQMFGALGIIADEDDFQKEAVKITGTAGEEGKYAIGTSQFDKNTSKYDLKTVENYTSHTTEANRADIDIKHIDEVTYDWKLTSDADGNIRIYRDNTEMASLTKTQGVASITNKDVQEFDARTKLVTNYVAALDRNMGSDRNGNKWYNEGWDELHCKELRISYTMGFARDNNGSAGQRSAALNIKANGVLDNRSDMFNGAENKNRTWRFLTSEKSLAAQDKNVGYIGTFNGIQVFVPGMQSLFTSKLFYTSNTSVMDLN